MPRRVLAALAVFSLASFLSAASAGSALAAPTWLSPTNLSTAGFGTYGPKVGIDGSGESVATWFGTEEGIGERAQVATRPRGGSWSASPLTLSPDSSYQTDLAVAPNGTAVALWELDSEEGSPDGSFIEASVRSGGSWSVASSLPRDVQLQFSYFPRVAVSPSGDALAVWQQCYSADKHKCFHGEGEYEVRASVRPAGGEWSMPMFVTTDSENAIKLSPAINSAGEMAIAWEDMGKAAHVAIRRDGGPWVSQALAGTPGGSPQVAFAANGAATVVWDGKSGPGYWIYQSVSAPGSTAWSAPTAISPDGVNGFQPVLAVAPNGDAVAAWETLGAGPSSGFKVQAAYRSGGAWQPAQDVSADGPSENLFPRIPRVAISPAGAAVAVWQIPTASGSLVQANARPAGSGWSGITNLSSAGADATEPAVAVDSEGNATAAWRTGSGVSQAAGFDAVGPRFDGVSIPSSGGVGQSLSFSAAPSDAWSGVASTSWSFGDGGSASGASVSHAFSAPGTYTVTVTTSDGLGSSSSATGTVVVSAPPAVPVNVPQAPLVEKKEPKKTPKKVKVGIAHAPGILAVVNGKAVLKLRCGGGGPCNGLAKLVYKGTSVIGKGSFQIAAGGTKTLRVKIGPAALELLESSPGQKLTVQLEGRGLKPRKVVLEL